MRDFISYIKPEHKIFLNIFFFFQVFTGVLYADPPTIVPYILCSNRSSYDLTEDIYLNNYSGVWVDSTNPPSDNIFNVKYIDLTKIESGVYSYYYPSENKMLRLTYIKTDPSGDPMVLQTVCDDSVDLFSTLKPGTYGLNGTWYNTAVYPKEKVSNFVKLKPGKNFFAYQITVNKDCPIYQWPITYVTPTVDSSGPVLSNCIQFITRQAPDDVNYYTFETDEIKPSVTDNSCLPLLVTNDMNKDSTLVGYRIFGGVHPITWTFSDQAGNKATCLVTLTVHAKGNPNLFSPNGDGHNDTWVLSLDPTFENAILEIFNRQGAPVVNRRIEKDQYVIEWDGRSSQGKDLPADGYIYLITKEGETKAKGVVTLIR